MFFPQLIIEDASHLRLEIQSADGKRDPYTIFVKGFFQIFDCRVFYRNKSSVVLGVLQPDIDWKINGALWRYARQEYK